MVPPQVAAIFPPFENPEHFERTRTGRYICTLCPIKAKDSPPTFPSEKAALAHERSEDHAFCVSLEKNNPWNIEAVANSADWGTEAANDTTGMTPEELKELEYRRKVDAIPVTVEKWRSEFVAYAHAGEMVPVDKPKRSPAALRREAKKQKASKSVDASTTTTKSDVSSEDERRKTPMLPDSGRSSLEKPSPTPPTIIHPISQLPPVEVRRPPRRIVPSNSPRVELTPALRAWMADMVIEMRFSPTRARQMQEFIQLPTDTKVHMVERSAWDLRSRLFT